MGDGLENNPKKSISDFFKSYIKADSLFKNKKVLQTTYVPGLIIHREEEISNIAGILAPVLKEDLPSNIFIYGKTGTGKTLAVKHIQSELSIVAKENNIALQMLFINCKLKKSTDTEYRLIAELTRMLGREVPATGLPTSEIYDHFISAVERDVENSAEKIQYVHELIQQAHSIYEQLKRKKTNTIYINIALQESKKLFRQLEQLFSKIKDRQETHAVEEISVLSQAINDYLFDAYEITKEKSYDIHFFQNNTIAFDESRLVSKGQLIILLLDEIDQLVGKIGDEILYTLTRLNSDLKYSQLAILGISNDMTFADNLEPRVRSSLREEDVVFPPYNALQLQEILYSRVKEAFEDGAIEQGVVEKCSAYAARDHGDARRALDLLRVAGEVAEREQLQKVTIEHIDIAEQKIEKDRVMDIVKSQPKQSQAALFSILSVTKENEFFFTGDIYDTYKTVCSNSSLRPLTMRRISDIIAELDTLGIINAQVMSKGRYGRTRKISMSLPVGMAPKLCDVLEQSLGFK